MKVYQVCEYDHSGYAGLHGIFATKDEAECKIELLIQTTTIKKKDLDIEEFDLDLTVNVVMVRRSPIIEGVYSTEQEDKNSDPLFTVRKVKVK